MVLHKNSLVLLLAALFALSISSCVKTEFDEPEPGPVTVTLTPNTTIKDLKALHKYVSGKISFDTIKTSLVIKGTVVIDDRSGNYYKTLAIQDETGGLDIVFNDGYLYTKYPVGSTLYIDCQGLMLTDYNGLTQLVGGTYLENGAPVSHGITLAQRQKQVQGDYAETVPQPKTITLADLNDDLVSTLVRIENVEFSSADAGKVWADAFNKINTNRTLRSCTGQIALVRTSGYATFANGKTPTGNGALVGILSKYRTDWQIYIRDTTDVDMSGERCGAAPATTLNETFSDISTDGATLDASGWTNIAVAGTRVWTGEIFNSTKYAQASAYQSGLANMEAWLISPKIVLTTAKTLQFESAMAYWKHDGLRVYVSNNFNGTDPKAATWTELNCTLAGQSSANHAWVPSGVISLPIYASGYGHIAFVYTGNSSQNTTDYRVDNVKVQ